MTQLLPVFTESARALASSDEAYAIRAGMRSATEQAMEALAKAYAAKAQALGADPMLWCIPWHESRASAESELLLLPLFLNLMPSPRKSKAIELIAGLGASPWLSRSGRGLAWRDSADIVRYVLGIDRQGNQSTRKHCLKAAASTAMAARAQGAPIDDFIAVLARGYGDLAQRSSKTSKGVLGPADKEARECAATLTFCEESLRALAAALGDAPAAHELELALADAKERLAVKNDKAAASPEKVKKSITVAQRERLDALMALCRDHANDEQLIALAFDATDWLAREPMAASVRFARSGSLVQAALAGGSSAALLALEKMGANVWLAAAQHGEANACLWVAETLWSAHKAVDLGPLARMLMVGAWLDGAQDPKARCEALAREALAEARGQRVGSLVERAQGLLSLIERQALDEAIAQHQSHREDPSPKASRRGAL